MSDDGAGRADEPELPDESEHPECDQVMRDVWLFLDNEMDPQARAAVERHLEDCPPCLKEAGLEDKLKKLVHRTCGGERAPDQLRMRLTSAIRSVRTTTQVGPQGQVRIRRTEVRRTRVQWSDPAGPDAGRPEVADPGPPETDDGR